MKPLDFDDLLKCSSSERRQFAAMLEDDFELFCKWAFWLMLGIEFEWNIVHQLKADALSLVEDGIIKRLIINEPPRFSKTEEVVILWPAWSMIKNGRSRFFVVSGSDTLVQEGSGRVRDFLMRPEVALLWPHVGVKFSANTKELWKTLQGGAFRAAPLEGQITGFGAGVLKAKVFSGALVLDDLLKAQESQNILRMEKINGMYLMTLRNRLNDMKNTPVVVLAQRLHDADICGFLLGGGSGEKWYHLRIPGVVLPDEEDAARERYKRDWSYGIPLETNLPYGFVWPDKYDAEVDEAFRIDPDSWATQIIQNPRQTKGSLLRTSWFKRYDQAVLSGNYEGFVMREGEKVRLTHMMVFADTAAKVKEANDYSVFQLWGMGIDRNIYLLDQIRGKWEAPELEKVSTVWLQKYEPKAPKRYGWREIGIEDKSSGIGLIQSLQRKWGAHIKPIPRNKDKVTRAISACLYLEAGRVWIPKPHIPWVPEFVAEAAAFNKQMTHLHDDQLDPMFDAIENMLHNSGGSIFDVVS